MKYKHLIPLLLVLAVTGCAALKKKGAAPDKGIEKLAGTWVLDVLSYPAATLDSLYPRRKPELTFDPAAVRFSGYSGCNYINGPLSGNGSEISFKGDIAMTYMACPGEGEKVFMDQLKRINHYNVSTDGKTLTMIQGDIALLRFHRK